MGITICGKAQYSLGDTIRLYLKKKPSYVLELDGRSSFIREQPVKIDGFRLGLDYGDKIRLYGGAYWTRYPAYRTIVHNASRPDEVKLKQRLSMFYVAATAEYVVFSSPHWELRLPVQLGIGVGNRQRFLDSNNAEIEQKYIGFMPLEITFSASYYIVPWAYVSGGLGYRYAMFSPQLTDDFSAPIYTVGFGIAPITLLKKLGIVESKNGKLQLKKHKKDK